MTDPRERLLELLVERSFRVGDFELSSGRRSDYYVDCRTVTMHAEGQVLVGAVGCDALEGRGIRPDLVGGLTMGADPISYAIAGESWRRGDPIHAFSVRKRPKRHGGGRRIEGCFEAGARVVITEDVITSGGSALTACAAVEEAGSEVLAVLGLVDRGEGGAESLRDAGHELISLYTAEELRGAHERAAPAAGRGAGD